MIEEGGQNNDHVAPEVEEIAVTPKSVGLRKMLLEDQQAGEQLEQEAELKRQGSYDAVHEWFKPSSEAYQLLPYTDGREDLVHALGAADMALPPGRMFGSVDTLRPFAVRVLFVCSHQPDELRAMRSNMPRLVAVVEEWGEKFVPRSRKEQAVALALSIHNTPYDHLAVMKPSDVKKGGEAGN